MKSHSRPSFRLQAMHAGILICVLAAMSNEALSAAPPRELRGESGVGASHPGVSVYRSAGCISCHKWHGMGGPGYGGTPINFREMSLDRDQTIETVACGRPGTGMPYHHKGAYESYACYDGMTKEELGEDAPGASRVLLSYRQIKNVSDFILEHFKGRSNDLVKADCTIFSGESRMCRNLKAMGAGGGAGH